MGARGELTEEAWAFLDAHRVGRLATANAAAEPHVVPICWARLGERLYFVADDKPKRHGPLALKRLANLGENPRAALLVDDYDDDWRRLAFVLLHVDTEPVRDAAEYDAALEALRRRYPAYRDMSLAIETHPMIRMTVRRWHSWRAANDA